MKMNSEDEGMKKTKMKQSKKKKESNTMNNESNSNLDESNTKNDESNSKQNESTNKNNESNSTKQESNTKKQETANTKKNETESLRSKIYTFSVVFHHGDQQKGLVAVFEEISLKHNAAKCPSKTQDPDALKRKRKPPKGKGKSSTETHETTASNQNVDVATQNPAETLIDATQSQPEAAVDNFPTLFDEIPDEVMATLPDAVNGKVVKGKSVKSNTAKKPWLPLGIFIVENFFHW
ncbi:hypothetical protein P8452_13185 [Trifolium repens]|nr:hypothetical protein P8452_13185 [Trifolium repens]